MQIGTLLFNRCTMFTVCCVAAVSSPTLTFRNGPLATHVLPPGTGTPTTLCNAGCYLHPGNDVPVAVDAAVSSWRRTKISTPQLSRRNLRSQPRLTLQEESNNRQVLTHLNTHTEGTNHYGTSRPSRTIIQALAPPNDDFALEGNESNFELGACKLAGGTADGDWPAHGRKHLLASDSGAPTSATIDGRRLHRCLQGSQALSPLLLGMSGRITGPSVPVFPSLVSGPH